MSKVISVLGVLASVASSAATAATCEGGLLLKLNQKYMGYHRPYEDAFWASKMALTGGSEEEEAERSAAYKVYVSTPDQIPAIEAELKRTDLTANEKKGLEGWLNYFKINSIPGAKAQKIQAELAAMQGQINKERGELKTGYVDPKSGEFVKATAVKLRNMVKNAKEPADRKAAFEGLMAIDHAVSERWYPEVVKQRNRLARALGFANYYEWTVRRVENLSLQQIFSVLDELERKTRDAAKQSVEKVIAEKGDSARFAWNFDYYTAGTLSERRDPYYRFDASFERWGKSFSAMGYSYENAKLTIDLVDRAGKLSNGFMHAPVPSYLENGKLIPAEINFSASALPGQVGSGEVAHKTLFHEGAHAGNFSKVFEPGPYASQERAPTSVADAETQSMFTDQIIDSAEWQTVYATDKDGKPMPEELILDSAIEASRFAARGIRARLVVPYVEKAVYEMSDEELTPENIRRVARNVEKRMLFTEGSTLPVLQYMHVLSDESSAYYHGYVMADLAVAQTRAHFMKKYGAIVNNPQIGADLEREYWAPGNTKTFFAKVKSMTGEAFSADAKIAELIRTPDQVAAGVKAGIERGRRIPKLQGPVRLNARISIIHGDQVIASSQDGQSFEEMNERFVAWIRGLEEKAKAEVDKKK